MPTIAYDIDAATFDLPAFYDTTHVIRAYDTFLRDLDLAFPAYVVAAAPTADRAHSADVFTVTVRTTNPLDLCDAIDLDPAAAIID